MCCLFYAYPSAERLPASCLPLPLRDAGYGVRVLRRYGVQHKHISDFYFIAKYKVGNETYNFTHLTGVWLIKPSPYPIPFTGKGGARLARFLCLDCCGLPAA